jgi:hypothetical protein
VYTVRHTGVWPDIEMMLIQLFHRDEEIMSEPAQGSC